MTPTSQFTPFESNGLVYKPHPRFLTQNFGKKVRLIHEFLRYNSWNRGKCKLKSRIKLNSNIHCTGMCISMIQLKLLISNRCCCWWLPLTLFEFSSYYSHSWSSYTCSSSCWHWLYLLFKGYPFKKSLSFIYEHFLLLIFSRNLHLRRKRIFLLCSLW